MKLKIIDFIIKTIDKIKKWNFCEDQIESDLKIIITPAVKNILSNSMDPIRMLRVTPLGKGQILGYQCITAGAKDMDAVVVIQFRDQYFIKTFTEENLHSIIEVLKLEKTAWDEERRRLWDKIRTMVDPDDRNLIVHHLMACYKRWGSNFRIPIHEKPNLLCNPPPPTNRQNFPCIQVQLQFFGISPKDIPSVIKDN